MTVCLKCLLSECSAQHPLLMCSLSDCAYVCHYECMDVEHRRRYETNKRHWLCPTCHRTRTNTKHATLFRDAPSILCEHPRENPAALASIDSDVFEITPPVSPVDSDEDLGSSDDEVHNPMHNVIPQPNILEWLLYCWWYCSGSMMKKSER